MAMAFKGNSLNLSSFRDALLPGVWHLAGKAAAEGVPIESADIQVDYLHDDIKLCVVHSLVRRGDIDRGQTHYVEAIGQRLNAAMRLFHRMPAAKALCVDRRRLNARGEQARKNKAKRA